MNKFATIIEEIQRLSIDEIEEINSITKNLVIQARRDEILMNSKEAKLELMEGNLKSYDNIDSLFEALKINDGS